MNRTTKSLLGVTLLEIMLVLAIAAMVIVMSVRYYQTATASSRVNDVSEQVQAIVAAADGLSQGSGSYASPGVTSANIVNLLPTGGLTLPWGSTITFGVPTATTYTIQLTSVPANSCGLIEAKFSANSHFSVSGVCAAAPAVTLVTVVYTSTT